MEQCWTESYGKWLSLYVISTFLNNNNNNDNNCKEDRMVKVLLLFNHA